MKKLITILILILFTTIAMSQNTYIEIAKELSKEMMVISGDDCYGLIVKQANEEWKGDYSMIAYEIKKQCKAFCEVFIMEKPTGITENIFNEIRVRAVIDWSEYNSDNKLIKADWTMVLYEIKKQIKAYLEIH